MLIFFQVIGMICNNIFFFFYHYVSSRLVYRFYSHGHEVIGVELAEKPVFEFYVENNIDHSVEELKEKAKLYKVSIHSSQSMSCLSIWEQSSA